MEKDEVCDEGTLNGTGEGHCAKGCKAVQACGNGTVEGTETCDEGVANTDSWSVTKSCNATCSGPNPFCGDGVVLAEEEACDDGAENGGYDRCKTDCSGLGPHCGDGVVQAEHEACEPGLGDPCDGCILDCSGRAGEAVCGDGVVCPATEACDDRFQDACGTCNATCTAAGSGSVCGDGDVCPETEVCDPGPSDPCNTCVPGCTALGGGPVCGDNKLCLATEVCDDGDTVSNGEAHCVADCSAVQTCGNGTAEGTEVCDDGNTNDCAGNCLGDCSAVVNITGCGDGVVCPPEQCDDGNNHDPCDGCLDGCTAYSPSPGPTVVSSPIDEDTVWYAAQSPISLQQNVAILAGTTVIACPGTRIEAVPGLGIRIMVRGVLDARGSATQPVVFTSSAVAPAPGDWGGIYVECMHEGETIVSHAVVSYASEGLFLCGAMAASAVQDSVFEHNDVGLSHYSDVELEVTDSSFLENRCGSDGGRRVFLRSTFSGNEYGVQNGYEVRLDDCTVDGNVVGLSGSGTLTNCLISDNSSVGVDSPANGFAILNSTIVRNGVGIRTNDNNNEVPPIHQSVLCDNVGYDIQNRGSFDVDATDNWWCTTDPGAIPSRVWDVYDDGTAGRVTFQPFLTGPPPDAPQP